VWKWQQKGDIAYLTLPEWEQQGVKVAVSGRQGGYSTGEFASLNLALHVGDNPSTVLKNRELWAETVGVEPGDMVCACQTHSDHIAVVDEGYRGRGVFDYTTGLPDTDALVTDRPEVYLMAFYADCVPILLFDRVAGVVGLVHSGWKGTIARIAARTLVCMQKEFGCRVSDVMAFVGPSIGGCCYEVGQDLAARARRVLGLNVELRTTVEGKFFWDLPRTNQIILERAGLLSENILISSICTRCHQECFYSYRGSEGETGRIGVLLGLK
jgi:YfiH family protein